MASASTAAPKAKAAGKQTQGTKRLASQADLPLEGCKYKAGELKSQVTAYFRRVAKGGATKATETEKEEAQTALNTYSLLDEEDKIGFAKAFYNSKSSKSFGFIRDYTEKVSAVKKVNEKLNENYMTRTLCMHFPMSWQTAHAGTSHL